MNREILNNDAMENVIVSAPGSPNNGRALRVHDRLGIDSHVDADIPEESLVIDDRCDVSPAQMVESKLTRVLGGAAMLPVSHLQMRGLLRQR
jgi:hypothetical protein